MAQAQTSFRTDNCDECISEHGVNHCRVEEFVESNYGQRVVNARHLMLCTTCRRRTEQRALTRVVNLRAGGGDLAADRTLADILAEFGTLQSYKDSLVALEKRERARAGRA